MAAGPGTDLHDGYGSELFGYIEDNRGDVVFPRFSLPNDIGSSDDNRYDLLGSLAGSISADPLHLDFAKHVVAVLAGLPDAVRSNGNDLSTPKADMHRFRGRGRAILKGVRIVIGGRLWGWPQLLFCFRAATDLLGRSSTWTAPKPGHGSAFTGRAGVLLRSA
jgi:hypothetical protein